MYKRQASEGKENIVQEGKDKIGNLLHRGGSEHQGHHGLAGFGGEKAKEAEGTASGVTGVHGAGAGTTAGQASGAAAASGSSVPVSATGPATSGSTATAAGENLPESHSVSVTQPRESTLTHATSTGSNVNVAAGNVDQDVQHLAPVTHATHHRHEIEELIREREHHVHQHHIQHHVQPVLDSEHGTEQLHSRVVPETTIREVHANTDKDAALMRSVAGTYKDSFTHAPIDRSVIDRGETVREITHHHIHNVVQPIIERDSHEYHRIRTTIPTTHITHEAPIVHESTAHQPIRKEDFLKGGGVLNSTTRTIDDAGVLNLGSSQRTVEGGENYSGGYSGITSQ